MRFREQESMFEKPWTKKGLQASGNQSHILSLLFYQRNVIPWSSSALEAKRGLSGQKEKGTGKDYEFPSTRPSPGSRPLGREQMEMNTNGKGPPRG